MMPGESPLTRTYKAGHIRCPKCGEKGTLLVELELRKGYWRGGYDDYRTTTWWCACGFSSKEPPGALEPGET